jgi:hypothetical protein
MPPDLNLTEAFLDALKEKFDAEEFEKLMLDEAPPHLGGDLDSFFDHLNLFNVRMGLGETRRMGTLPALRQLKMSKALDALKGRYPDVWEQVVMSEATVDV